MKKTRKELFTQTGSFATLVSAAAIYRRNLDRNPPDPKHELLAEIDSIRERADAEMRRIVRGELGLYPGVRVQRYGEDSYILEDFAPEGQHLYALLRRTRKDGSPSDHRPMKEFLWNLRVVSESGD